MFHMNTSRMSVCHNISPIARPSNTPQGSDVHHHRPVAAACVPRPSEHMHCVQIREDMAQRMLSIHQGARQIDLRVPKNDSAQPSVTFSKQGPLDDGDLPLLGRLMLLSNDLNLPDWVASSSPRTVRPVHRHALTATPTSPLRTAWHQHRIRSLATCYSIVCSAACYTYLYRMLPRCCHMLSHSTAERTSITQHHRSNLSTYCIDNVAGTLVLVLSSSSGNSVLW